MWASSCPWETDTWALSQPLGKMPNPSGAEAAVVELQLIQQRAAPAQEFSDQKLHKLLVSLGISKSGSGETRIQSGAAGKRQ